MSSRAERSLPPGRSTQPLDENDVRRVSSTFLGLASPEVVARYDEHGYTRFHVIEEDAEQYGCIYFGPDIYPGQGIADPNAALGMKAAVAHELCHLHRWEDHTEFPLDEWRNLDEALTSLEATVRYGNQLSKHDIDQLVRDAMQRLYLLRAELP